MRNMKSVSRTNQPIGQYVIKVLYGCLTRTDFELILPVKRIFLSPQISMLHAVYI